MEPLTHSRQNKLPHTIYGKESNFNFRYVRLYDLEITRETVETLIRLQNIWSGSALFVNYLLEGLQFKMD